MGQSRARRTARRAGALPISGAFSASDVPYVCLSKQLLCRAAAAAPCARPPSHLAWRRPAHSGALASSAGRGGQNSPARAFLRPLPCSSCILCARAVLLRPGRASPAGLRATPPHQLQTAISPSSGGRLPPFKAPRAALFQLLLGQLRSRGFTESFAGAAAPGLGPCGVIITSPSQPALSSSRQLPPSCTPPFLHLSAASCHHAAPAPSVARAAG